MAKNLNWKGKADFNAAPLKDIQLPAGPKTFMQVRESGLLRVFYVEQAGHMVPTDQPAAAFHAMDSLLFPNDQSSGGECNCPPPSTCPPATEAEPCPATTTAAPCPVCTPSPDSGCSCPAPQAMSGHHHRCSMS